MSVGFAADLPDRDFKRDSWPKTDIPPFFFFLSAVHLTLCIPSSTFWQVDMPVNWRNKFPAAMPHQQKKTPPNTDPSFVLSAVCRKKRGAEAADFIGAQSFQWDSCDEELEAREEGAEEEGRLQLVQWSTFVHQIYGESRPKHRSCTKCRICDLS